MVYIEWQAGNIILKRGSGYLRNPLSFLVGGTGFEPVTSIV